MTNQHLETAPVIPSWAQSLYAAFDAHDIDGIVAHFADDVRLYFGNADPIVGVEAYRRIAVELPGGIRSMSHAFRDVWQVDELTTVLVADVTYIRRDGVAVRLPAATIIRRQEQGLVDELRVFVDVMPAVV